MSRHSEFTHGSRIPEDSIDFDYDEIDRNIFGNEEVSKETPRAAAAHHFMDEITIMRKFIFQIASSDEPHEVAALIMRTQCPAFY